MAKKRPKSSGGEIPEWIVTYGDLMSLLLCFFILIAAFSELKKEEEYIVVLEAIKMALGNDKGFGGKGRADGVDAGALDELAQRARRTQDRARTNPNQEENVTGQHDRVSVVTEGQKFAVGGSVGFGEGDDLLDEGGRDLLRTQVAPRVRGQRFIVRVVGHAWGEGELASGFGYDELAFRRALAVKEFLVRECGVDPMTLRVESAGTSEPASVDATAVEIAPINRRVQVWMTGQTVDQAHPDPNYTGASAQAEP